MKIRTDFVTNSSSSSFILAFKNMGTVLDELMENKITEGYLSQLAKDCLNKDNAMTREEAIRIYEEEIYYDAKWEVEKESNLSWKEFMEWENKNPAEVQAQIRKIIEGRVIELERLMEDNEHIVMIEYADEDGDYYSKLEHEITPYLSNCCAVISHH